MIDVGNLVRIEYRGELVLTTKQLASAYECAPTHIRDNFKNNKRYFQEGVHYFKLTGDELREFKLYVNAEFNRAQGKCENTENFSSPALSATSSLLLWTYQGCVRHCKMVGTEKAWEQFTELENIYFAVLKQPALLEAAIDNRNAETLDLLIQIIHRDGAPAIERILDKLIKLTK